MPRYRMTCAIMSAACRLLPAEEIALFDALLLMLQSDSLVGETIERIQQGNWAPGALR